MIISIIITLHYNIFLRYNLLLLYNNIIKISKIIYIKNLRGTHQEIICKVMVNHYHQSPIPILSFFVGLPINGYVKKNPKSKISQEKYFGAKPRVL